jgi:hypothetical protein
MPRNKLAPPVQNALVTLDEDGNVNYPSPINFAGLIPGPEPSGYQSRVARYLQHVLGGVDQSINAGYQSLYGRQSTIADAMGAAGLAITGGMPAAPGGAGTLTMGVKRGLPDVSMPATPRSVVPAPQRWLDPAHKEYNPVFGATGYEPGGRYLSPGQNMADVTGTTPAAARLNVSPEGKPSFKISEELSTAAPNESGALVKTNLFKKKAGWSWVKAPEGFPENPAKDFPLISVETQNKHFYALSSDYPQGVNLSRYANSASEPRLRPTAKGDVYLGNEVGRISVRGVEHPVYDRVVIK